MTPKEKCDIPAEFYKAGPIDFKLPIVIWDGECAFCAHWIKRWKNITGDKIQYVPYQFFDADERGRLRQFSSLSIKDCEAAVQLVMPDGAICHGAEAVFRVLNAAGKNRGWLWLYQHFPGFKFLSEGIYNLIASHRSLFSKISK